MPQGRKGQGGKTQPAKRQAARSQAPKRVVPVPQARSARPAPARAATARRQSQPAKKQANRRQADERQPRNNSTTARTNASQDFLNSFISKNVNLPGGIDLTAIPNTDSLLDLAISQQQQGFIREINKSNQTQELDLANADNKTRIGIADLNLHSGTG
jgi:hypothetical protein